MLVRDDDIRLLRRIEAYILHHTQSSPETKIETVKGWHTDPPPDGHGWADVGYGFLIRKGVRCVGRQELLTARGPRPVIGAHAYSEKLERGWNSRSIGIALVGKYRPDRPPPREQIDVLLLLLTDLSLRFGRLRILGHREAMAEIGDPEHTDCPGGDWPEDVRREIGWGQDPSSCWRPPG
jgi:hypothetical protein